MTVTTRTVSIDDADHIRSVESEMKIDVSM